MKLSFELGRVGMTQRIATTTEQNESFATQLHEALTRYKNCDWGEVCDEDKKLNDNDVIRNDGARILARYGTCEGDIYILTYLIPAPDRYTTIMFTEEY